MIVVSIDVVSALVLVFVIVGGVVQVLFLLLEMVVVVVVVLWWCFDGFTSFRFYVEGNEYIRELTEGNCETGTLPSASSCSSTQEEPRQQQ